MTGPYPVPFLVRPCNVCPKSLKASRDPVQPSGLHLHTAQGALENSSLELHFPNRRFICHHGFNAIRHSPSSPGNELDILTTSREDIFFVIYWCSMGRKKGVIAVIKIPSFAEVIAKVRGVSPPAGKITVRKKVVHTNVLQKNGD